MTTYYVLDDRTGDIVNAIECDGPAPTIDPARWENAEHLFIKRENELPLATLQRYPYWDTRP